MKSIHNCVESSLSSWSDPGCYPSGAGGGPLSDGPSCPEDISGFIIYEVTPEEKAQLDKESIMWEADKQNLGPEDVGGLFEEIYNDMSVDGGDTRVRLRDMTVQPLGTKFVLAVPKHWLIDGQDDIGGPDYKIDAEIKQAVQWLQKHNLAPKEL